MTSQCHNCGREYLTARAMAGKAIACRTCGALNDGAGGPPPAQPKRETPSAAKVAASKPISGESFSVGGKPKAVNQQALNEAYQTAVEAKAAAVIARQRERDGGTARLIRSLGIVAFALVGIIVGGLFLVRHLGSKTAGVRWDRYQLAVPQITSDSGSGTGFVIEDKGKLWLVTNFHVIEGAREVTAWFRSPADGSVLFRLPSIETRKFLVHTQFLTVKESAEDGRNFDLAVVNLEEFRPQIENIGVVPLEIASSSDFAVGERVVALGHIASRAFELESEGDDAAEDVATHSLFDGLVSGIRRAPGKPTLVQTSANYGSGCSGGPLMLEGSQKVAGVNTWGEVNEAGTAKAGMNFSLAADQVLDVVRTGSPLQSVREEIRRASREALPPAGEVEEVGEWSTFSRFSDFLEFVTSNGWKLTGQEISVTDKDGNAHFTHRVVGTGGVNVLVVALPRDRSIDLDIVEVAAGQYRGLGQDAGMQHGSFAHAIVNEPGTDQPAIVGEGQELDVRVGTLFLGEPISARYLIVVFEREATPESRIGDASGTGAPASPPPPADPGAPPPTLPNAPPLPAPPSSGKLADAIELRDGMASTVYASSLIGLREFDSRFLTNLDPAEAIDRIDSAFVEHAPSLEHDPEFASDIMRASLVKSFYFAPEDEMPLVQSRPYFEVLLESVPADTRVGVYLELDPVWKRYLPLPSGGMVSKTADIRLEAGGQTNAYRHDAGIGLFRVSLDLPWNDDELRKLTQAVEIPYTLVVRYNDGSEDRMSGRVRVNPVSQVELQYPFGLGFVAMVDETHPWVKRMIDEINQRPDVKAAGAQLLGSGGGPIDRLESMFLVWQELVRRGLRYQNLTAAEGFAQRCRLVHEAIGSRNANCIDGTVLLASFAQAMGIDSYIVLVPGHALLCVQCGDEWLFVETTMLGVSEPGDPVTDLDPEFAALRQKGNFYRTREMNSFEAACKHGASAVDKSFEDAGRILAVVRSMAAQFDQRKDDSAWFEQYRRALEELGNQIMIVPVSLARRNGVRPIGVPSDLDQRYPFPK